MLTDAHLHIFDFVEASGSAEIDDAATLCCASAWREQEFLWQESFARSSHERTILLSFGIHPQKPDPEALDFLETLAAGKRISAVGECGYDLYTPEYRMQAASQKAVREAQYAIAVRYGLPAVIHCRKALDLVFADAPVLRRIPAVVFHGWPGGLNEAESLLSKGINAWFCAGKGLLRNDRSLVRTVSGIPAERLLAETDAPYMRSKGESLTRPGDIVRVYQSLAALRGLESSACEDVIERNFRTAFGMFSRFP